MDWSLHTKCCTLAIATVTLGISVHYLTKKTREEFVVQPDPEAQPEVEARSESRVLSETQDSEFQPEAQVEFEALETQPELEVPETRLVPENPEAQSELQILEDQPDLQISKAQQELQITEVKPEPEVLKAQSELQITEVKPEPEVVEAQPEPEVLEAQPEPEDQSEPTVEMAAAVAQPMEVLKIVASMEQVKLVEDKPGAAAPEEVELPDRDSANHSPSDFLSNNLASDTQSESSNDSGKGGSDCPNANGDVARFDVITPPLSPAHNLVPLPERLFVYEFEIPQILCGLLIGRYGAYVSHIKSKTGASLFIKEQIKRNRLQLCAVEGTKSEIDAALALIRAKFPIKKYPHLTLIQINVAIESIPVLPDSIQLHLPQEVSCDVIISAIVAPNHIFIQQISHPTYSSLARLDACMAQCYNDLDTPVPQPVLPNIICAAPSMDGWYRAKVVAVYPPVEAAATTEDQKAAGTNETDFEVDICFVDYGGYSRVPASCLRQIRADFMSLPFQSVECFLANVAPVDGEEGWSAEAFNQLETLTSERMLQAQTVAFSMEGLPLIYLYQISSCEAQLVNRQLVDGGVAQWVEPQIVTN